MAAYVDTAYADATPEAREVARALAEQAQLAPPPAPQPQPSAPALERMYGSRPVVVTPATRPPAASPATTSPASTTA